MTKIEDTIGVKIKPLNIKNAATIKTQKLCPIHSLNDPFLERARLPVL